MALSRDLPAAIPARGGSGGRIDVLAFSIMTTHFHLVVRCRAGELDRVMQRVLDWMIRKARLEDGAKPGFPHASAARVYEGVPEEVMGDGDWRCVVAGTRERDAWPVVRVGLLRDLAGMTLADIGRREGCC